MENQRQAKIFIDIGGLNLAPKAMDGGPLIRFHSPLPLRVFAENLMESQISKERLRQILITETLQNAHTILRENGDFSQRRGWAMVRQRGRGVSAQLSMRLKTAFVLLQRLTQAVGRIPEGRITTLL